MLLDLAGRRLKCVRARAHTHTRIFDLQLVDSADKEANYQTLSERYTLGPCFG
jgi:hypothetical protein